MGGLLEGFARRALGVAGEPCGELEDVCGDRLAPLLDEEEAIRGRDGNDEDDAVDPRAFDELPAVADDEPQIPPGVQLLHAGIQREKTEPQVAEGRGSTWMQPPWARATAPTTVRPSPVPGIRSEPVKR